MTSLLDDLRPQYPATVAAFEAMQARDHLARVWRLDQGWQKIARNEIPAGLYQQIELTAAAPAYDLIYAGAGLGLLHAALMAQRYGYRVLVFDRSEIGCAHREWNISYLELARLVATGLVSWDELEPVIMAEYRQGIVRFHAAGQAAAELRLEGVLDVALDAGALLRLMRDKLLAAGATLLSGRSLKALRVGRAGPMRVEVDLEVLGTATQAETYSGRLLLDGMGSTSPLALLRFAGQPFAGVCPTVGTVVTGLEAGQAADQHDPGLGDILVTVADAAPNGQQYMWEGFPGRGDELTVYLFYYDRAGKPEHSLLALFEDYFAQLPSYKRPGPAFRHLKPVYGYIPARHSLHGQERPLLRGVLPVGDSAAQQSPLTFCGFGSHVRNLARTTSLLDMALRHELLAPAQLASVSSFQVNVSLNWVFSRFMTPWHHPQDVNKLQQVFVQVLEALGHELAVRFYRDQMRWSDYHKLLLGTFVRYPQIILIAAQVLGAEGIVRWIGDYLRFSLSACMANLGRRAGPRGRYVLERLAAWVSSALHLRIKAAFEHWQVMGWLGPEATLPILQAAKQIS